MRLKQKNQMPVTFCRWGTHDVDANDCSDDVDRKRLDRDTIVYDVYATIWRSWTFWSERRRSDEDRWKIVTSSALLITSAMFQKIVTSSSLYDGVRRTRTFFQRARCTRYYVERARSFWRARCTRSFVERARHFWRARSTRFPVLCPDGSNDPKVVVVRNPKLTLFCKVWSLFVQSWRCLYKVLYKERRKLAS